MNERIREAMEMKIRPTQRVREFMEAQATHVLQGIINADRGTRGRKIVMAAAQNELERRRRGRPWKDRQIKAWMERHGLMMGDMVDVTNAAGRTFTGNLVDFRPPLGYIALDGDPHFAFSMLDAKVRKSRAKKAGSFKSEIPKGALDLDFGEMPSEEERIRMRHVARIQPARREAGCLE